jgi:tetratricopeptide (TPR) repeat protein
MQLLLQGNSAFIPEAVYWKRSRKESLTGTWGNWPLPMRIASTAEYLALMVEVVAKAPVNSQERAELLAMLHYHLMRYISADPKHFARDRFSEAQRLNLVGIVWARVLSDAPLGLEEAEHLLQSRNLESFAEEIIKFEGQLQIQLENKRSARSASAFHDLSKRFQSAKMLDDAIEAAKQAKELEPHSAHRWVRLGALFLKVNKDSQAETAFLQAIKLQPGSASAHYHMGLLLKRRGQVYKAIECVRTASNLRPDVSNYKNLLEELENGALT